METPEQTLPTLLYLLCAMSSMAFLVSSYAWLWKTSKNPQLPQPDFKSSVHKGQLYAFFTVMVLSIFIGGYDHFFNDREIHIGGEVFILMAALIYAYVKSDGDHKVSHVSRTAFRVMRFGLFCIFGWCVTIILGYVLTRLLGGAGGVDPNVVFLTGLSWNIPIAILYTKIVKKSDGDSAYRASAFHKFLWPVLMAYTVLLVPLLVQQISVSEEWKQMKNEKPVRSV